MVVISLCILAQTLLVVGQLFLKRAMAPGNAKPWRGRMATLITLGLLTNTFYFFIWLGLLEQNPLTKVFPFEGINPLLMAILGWVVLKERFSLPGVLGLLMICAGITIVWR
jgi:uncharacterized membrane protein